MSKTSPNHLYYVQQAVLHDHFCIYRNNFYRVFRNSSSIYKFVSSAAGTAWGSPQHGQILHPRNEDIDTPSSVYKMIKAQQELPGSISGTVQNSCRN